MFVSSGLTVTEAQLDRYQNRLDTHFAELAASRADLPLYFIEHDLLAEEVAELQSCVSHALHRFALTPHWWRHRSLPLLVTAAELGYEYEGNGTEFWPRLRERLDCAFEYSTRSELSRLFAVASERFNGATPPHSDWANTFCHIAWPITHAAVPRDIRLPLAQALARLPLRATDVDDGVLYDAIRNARTDWDSLRYQSWLENRTLVIHVSRALLGIDTNNTPALSPCFWRRVSGDIRNESDVRRQLAAARRRQKHAHRQKAPPVDIQDTEVHLNARFCLNRDGRRFKLFGELPEFPVELRRRLRVPLRTRSWSPIPWGLESEASLRKQAVLQRVPFPLSFRSLAHITAEASFFSFDYDVGISTEDQSLLSRVTFDTGDPLLFEWCEADGELAYQLHSSSELAPRLLAVVSEDRAPESIEGIEPAGHIEGGVVLALDMTCSHARSWLGLSAQSSRTSDTARWHWTFPAALNSGATSPKYRLGDPLAIVTHQCSNATLTHRQDGDDIACWDAPQDGIASLRHLAAGHHRLLFSLNGQVVDDITFDLVEDQFEELSYPCEIDVIGPTMSANDLIRRQLVIEIDSIRQWHNVPVTIRLEGTAATITETMSLPRRIGPKESVWDALLSMLDDSNLRADHDFTLSVTVSHIAHRVWRLEGHSEEVWWDVDNQGNARPVSDKGTFSPRYRSASTLLSPVLDTPQPAPVLLLPHADIAGNMLHFDGLFCHSASTAWPDEVRRPRLLRAVDSSDDGIGIRELVTTYIQFASATVNNIVADFHRRRIVHTLRSWLLRVSCGRRWHGAIQAHSHVESSSPSNLFWSSVYELGVPSLPDDAAPVTRAFFEPLCSAVNDVLPPEWWHGPIVKLSDTQGEHCDALMQHALRRSDFYTDTTTWQTALRNATWRLNGDFLADLVLPPQGSDELLESSVADLEIGELVPLLDDWRIEYLSGIPTRLPWDGDFIGILLSLLLAPWNLRRLSWEALLPGLVEDRCLVRAVAFIAWRSEQQSRLLEYSREIPSVADGA